MDQGVTLFPEDELIGLKVELCSGGASVNWMLSERCCGGARVQGVGILWETFSCVSLLTRVFLPWVPKSSSSCCVAIP